MLIEKRHSWIPCNYAWNELLFYSVRADVLHASASGGKRVRFHPPKNQKEKHTEVSPLAAQHTHIHTRSVSALLSPRS